LSTLSTEYWVLNNRSLIANTAYGVLHPLIDRAITAAIALVGRIRTGSSPKGRYDLDRPSRSVVRSWGSVVDKASLSGEAASMSSENKQPFLSQKIPTPSETPATYDRRSTYLIQVRETRVLLATFPRVLLGVLQYLAA